jgi:hypothetical protein
MFSVRMEQLHSKRPTLNVQCLTQKVDRPLRRTMLQVCGCAAIINIEQGTARSTYLVPRIRLAKPTARQVTRISRIIR